MKIMAVQQSLTSLSTADILDKEFRTELRGYSTNEVDEFLDEIISDYMKLYKEIERLTEENKRLLERSQIKVAEPIEEKMQSGSSNYDVIKRVSLLEKQVMEIMNHLKRRAEQEKQAQLQKKQAEPMVADKTTVIEF